MYETLGYKQKLEKDYDVKIFTNNINFNCLNQIEQLLKQDMFKEVKVRLMPDTHAGVGAVIGFTAKMTDKVIPSIVGSDIGCGMFVVNLGKIKLDLENLDKLIRQRVPLGVMMHDKPIVEFKDLDKILFVRPTKFFLQTIGPIKGRSSTLISQKYNKQLGTLGGGNHFIEIDKDDEDNKYLVIHTGSRLLGNVVSHYYQNLAIEQRAGMEDYLLKRKRTVEYYKENNKRTEIQTKLKEIDKNYKDAKRNPKIPEDLCYLEGSCRDFYLHDMELCQEYAKLNRETIAKTIINCINELMGYNISIENSEHYHTIHNYIDFEDNIIRKGAVRAKENTKLIIPMNMRDGSLICMGKGNPDWNYSAPHGAGRLMSRGDAKAEIKLEDFEKSMEGIYSSTVNRYTLDESPFVYKPMDEIIENIKDSVDIVKIIKPIYNLKGTHEEEKLYCLAKNKK